MTSVLAFVVNKDIVCMLHLSHAGQQRMAFVQFNSRGVSGNITFTEESDASIRIETMIDGLRGKLNV